MRNEKRLQVVYGLSIIESAKVVDAFEKLISCGGKINIDEFMELTNIKKSCSKPTTKQEK